MSSPYNPIAGMYHALWFDWYLPAAMPALENLFFARVEHGAKVLDVCCGSGHVTKEFVKRGYHVTGVDNSADLIALAREQLPQAQFVVQDVCDLKLPEHYDAAVSTFDSFNHILTIDKLALAFAGVLSALRSNGDFCVRYESARGLHAGFEAMGGGHPRQ